MNTENAVLIGLELENCCLVEVGDKNLVVVVGVYWGGGIFLGGGDEQIFSWWWGGGDRLHPSPPVGKTLILFTRGKFSLPYVNICSSNRK